MNETREKHVVLGAGPLGTVLAKKLEQAGKKVQLLSIMNNPAYDMPGTLPAAIDGADYAQVREACEGAGTVFLCLNAHYVDWYGLYPPRLEVVLEAVDEAIVALLVDSQGDLWAGHGEGLLHYDGEIWERIESEFSMDDVYAIAQDRRGRIWVGGENGLSVYDPASD